MGSEMCIRDRARTRTHLDSDSCLRVVVPTALTSCSCPPVVASLLWPARCRRPKMTVFSENRCLSVQFWAYHLPRRHEAFGAISPSACTCPRLITRRDAPKRPGRYHLSVLLSTVNLYKTSRLRPNNVGQDFSDREGRWRMPVTRAKCLPSETLQGGF